MSRPRVTPTVRRMHRNGDEGAVLLLVLVLIVIGALIVIPLMGYTIAVLNANRVEQEKTRNVEAAKGGIRTALLQPGELFGDKDRANAGCPADPAVLLPADGVVARDIPVSVTCTPIRELSANEVFGFDVPVGAAQLQIAPDPEGFVGFSGVTTSSGQAPAYPTVGFDVPWAWWQSVVWTNPEDPSDTKSVWIPDLPSFTDETRSSTPLDMPGFDCQVFLPGRYPDPLVIDGTASSDQFYFASGVYYFEQPVTISGDIDVVVGQGLADFGVSNDCADDTQVGANVVVPPNTLYGIDGNSGGATWVFGDQGRLEVSDAGGSPSVRFNQRYATEDRGRWTNILSVNGDWSYDNGDVDDDDDNDDPTGAHTATNVNYVARSSVLQLDSGGNPTSVALGASGAAYVPSHPDLTDEARVPDAPTAVAGATRVLGTDGAILVTFEGVEGEATNGAIVTGYEAGVEAGAAAPAMPSPTATCTTADDPSPLVPTAEGIDGLDPWMESHPENAADPDTYACLITGVTIGSTYWVTARAQNDAGWGEWASPTSVAAASWSSTETVLPPSRPNSVEVRPLADDPSRPDGALVTWDPPTAINGAPVVRYDVEVYRVFTELVPPPTTSPPPTSAPPPTTAPPTTAPPVPTETEQLLDVAEARCSSVPRLGKAPADQGREWTPPPTECVLDELADLSATGEDGNTNVGYRVKVLATNVAGASDPAVFEPPFMSTPGTPTAESPVPAERVWFPFHLTPIISIDASGAGSTVIDIPGFVSVPMGRVEIVNPDGDEISIAGGVTAGRIIVDDSRSPLPIGYVPSVVMQREILITSVAGNVTSKATVKVNSDTSYGILRWITQ